jgi:hypothetical protein
MNPENNNPEATDPAAGEDEVTNALAQAGEGEGEGEKKENGEGEETAAGEDEVTNALAQAGEGEGEGEKKENGEGEETAEDIEKAITEGDNEFKGKWDAEQVKGMAPLLKELGVSKENASKLAVKLAELQTQQVKAYELKMRQEQIARIKEQDAKNAQEFSKADYKQIHAGMLRYTKPDGCLRRLLTTTELGTDPEVLRILHHLGSKQMEETNGDAASGSSAPDSGWAEAFEK